jgi:hypothetical protein
VPVSLSLPSLLTLTSYERFDQALSPMGSDRMVCERLFWSMEYSLAMMGEYKVKEEKEGRTEDGERGTSAR